MSCSSSLSTQLNEHYEQAARDQTHAACVESHRLLKRAFPSIISNFRTMNRAAKISVGEHKASLTTKAIQALHMRDEGDELSEQLNNPARQTNDLSEKSSHG